MTAAVAVADCKEALGKEVFARRYDTGASGRVGWSPEMAAVAVADGTEALGKEVFARRYDTRASGRVRLSTEASISFRNTRRSRSRSECLI